MSGCTGQRHDRQGVIHLHSPNHRKGCSSGNTGEKKVYGAKAIAVYKIPGIRDIGDKRDAEKIMKRDKTMSTFFTDSKKEREIERFMREKPQCAKSGGKVEIIVRCENCSFYSKKTKSCRLSQCALKKGKKKNKCKGCSYGNGICNVCYREMFKKGRKNQRC